MIIDEHGHRPETVCSALADEDIGIGRRAERGRAECALVLPGNVEGVVGVDRQGSGDLVPGELVERDRDRLDPATVAILMGIEQGAVVAILIFLAG